MKVPQIIKATMADYPVIQNMARFYVYDMSRFCGQHFGGWECPEDGLFECVELKKYFNAKDKHAFIVKMDKELVGFVLINKLIIMPEVNWNMGEFFILAKFQRSGVGAFIAKQIFDQFSGEWSVGAITHNTRALNFWRKTIGNYTQGNFYEVEKTSEELKTAECPKPYPMIILRFNTDNKIK